MSGVVVNAAGRETKVKADALILDMPRAPSYELCEQAGARLEHAPRGFVPQVQRGKIRNHVFAMGEVTGAALDVAVFAEQAEAIVGVL